MANDSSEPLSPLGSPVVEDGLERVPFFNGRVLTAEDLEAEQKADAETRDRLGRALGTGVLEGLWVRRDEKRPGEVLVVEPGIAINREGRSIQFPKRIRVSVVGGTKGAGGAGSEGGFADCADRTSVEATGSGAYLLLVQGADNVVGRVPRTDLGGDGAAGSCGARRRREGGRLKLVPVDPQEVGRMPEQAKKEVERLEFVLADSDDVSAREHVAARSRLRNLLAHGLIGSFARSSVLRDPYEEWTDAARGHLDETREGGAAGPRSERPIDRLYTSEAVPKGAVPLAMFFWGAGGIEWLDLWSVRRRLHRLGTDRVPPATDRNRAIGAATTYQFQHQFDQLAEAFSAEELATVDVTRFLRFLPPIGVVPVTNFAEERGVDPSTFFGSCTTREPAYTEAPRLEDAIDRASMYPPIDLEAETLIRLYWIRENMQAVERGEARGTLLFTTGYMPDLAEARFDLSAWEYANYEGEESPSLESE